MSDAQYGIYVIGVLIIFAIINYLYIKSLREK